MNDLDAGPRDLNITSFLVPWEASAFNTSEVGRLSALFAANALGLDPRYFGNFSVLSLYIPGAYYYAVSVSLYTLCRPFHCVHDRICRPFHFVHIPIHTPWSWSPGTLGTSLCCRCISQVRTVLLSPCHSTVHLRHMPFNCRCVTVQLLSHRSDRKRGRSLALICLFCGLVTLHRDGDEHGGGRRSAPFRVGHGGPPTRCSAPSERHRAHRDKGGRRRYATGLPQPGPQHSDAVPRDRPPPAGCRPPRGWGSRAVGGGCQEAKGRAKGCLRGRGRGRGRWA